MRQFITLIEQSLTWFDKGVPVKISDWDAAEFLEDDEFYLDWRLCLVPSNEVLPRLLDQEESSRRIEDIQRWAGENLFELLKKEPPVLLLKTMQLLDGNNRVHVAQESGLNLIPMLVGA